MGISPEEYAGSEDIDRVFLTSLCIEKAKSGYVLETVKGNNHISSAEIGKYLESSWYRDIVRYLNEGFMDPALLDAVKMVL
jgi:hypothetical protein